MKYLKVIIIGIILGIGASFFSNYYLRSKYEIDYSITEKSFFDKYGSMIDKVETFYYIGNKAELERKKKQLKFNVSSEPSILIFEQQDKSNPSSFGINYFGYHKTRYTHQFFYFNTSMRQLPGFMRGYVETEKGEEIEALKFSKSVTVNNENLTINLIVAYESLLNSLKTN